MVVEGYAVERPVVNLFDLLDRVLDKGLVIDLWLKVSLVGIELLTLEARIVISGMESYLKYSTQMMKLGLIARPSGT
jgi:gas vesicle structural protein